MSEVNIAYSPEHNNICLVSTLNGYDYLILLKMNHSIMWEVDYVVEAAGIPTVKNDYAPAGNIHFRALVFDGRVELSYMKERGLPLDVQKLFEDQTNMLINKMKKMMVFL